MSMSDITVLVEKFLYFLALIGVGIGAQRLPWVTEKHNNFIVNMLIYILVPASILHSTLLFDLSFFKSFGTFSAMIAYHLFFSIILALISVKILKLDDKLKKSFIFLITHHNGLFIPLPIVASVFATQAAVHVIFYTELYFIMFLIVVPYVMGLSNKKMREFYVKLAPILFALFIGVIILFNKTVIVSALPNLITYVQPLLGQISWFTSPIALIFIGLSLKKPEHSYHNRLLFALVIIRLIISPIFGYFSVSLFNLTAVQKITTIIEFAAPPATFNIILMKKLDLDHNFGANAVFYATIISFFTANLFLVLSI